MKNLILASLLIFIAHSSISFASGQTLWCKGKITYTSVDASGNVYVVGDWRNEQTLICNINSTWNGIAPLTCASWFSQVMNASKSALLVQIQYLSSPYTCATLPTVNNSPTPYYVSTYAP
jgi:hypothetical protein